MRFKLGLALAMTALLAFVLFGNVTLAGSPGPAQTQAVADALGWLRTHQNADGGFGSPSDPGVSADVVTAIVAANNNPATWVQTTTSASLLGYLEAQANSYSSIAPSKAGKLVLAAVAADRDPTNFAGVNLISRVNGFYHSDTGVFGSAYHAYDQSYSILALRAAFEPIPDAAVTRLEQAQRPDGGWGIGGSLDSDTNATSLAIQALVAAGRSVTSTAMVSATQYLLGVQNADGGFPYQHTEPEAWPGSNNSDCDSTAYVLHALSALGLDPNSPTWKSHGVGPIDALLTFRLPNGGFYYQPGSDPDPFSTRDAIQALLGKSLPIPSRVVAVLPLVTSKWK